MRTEMRTEKRYFMAACYFNWQFNLGISICFQSPNIEIYFPFGFLRIGFTKGILVDFKDKKRKNGFGFRRDSIVSISTKPIIRAVQL